MMRHLAAFLSVVILVRVAALDTRSAALAQEATPNASPTASVAEGTFAGTVDSGGRALDLNCAGEGTPTVVIDHGQWGSSAKMGQLQYALSRDTRVCVYDQAGWGEAPR